MSEEELQQRLRDLEAEVTSEGRSSHRVAEPQVLPGDRPSGATGLGAINWNQLYQRGKGWFLSLPTPGRWAVGVVGALAVFTLLQTLTALISLAASLAALAAMGYVAYRLWQATSKPGAN